MGLSIGVLSACSGDKDPSAVIDCEDIDTTDRGDLIATYADQMKPAAQLYTGDEHQHTQAAVEQLEEVADVDWRIISAGFGVVTPTTHLPSYECTFQDDDSVRARLRRRGIDPTEYTIDGRIARLATELDIPSDLRDWFSTDLDVLFVLLGSDYLSAVTDTLTTIPETTRTYAFAPEGSRERLGRCEWVPSTATELQAHSTVWTRLKGLQLRTFAETINDSEDLLSLRGPEEIRTRSLRGQTTK